MNPLSAVTTGDVAPDAVHAGLPATHEGEHASVGEQSVAGHHVQSSQQLGGQLAGKVDSACLTAVARESSRDLYGSLARVAGW